MVSLDLDRVMVDLHYLQMFFELEQSGINQFQDLKKKSINLGKGPHRLYVLYSALISELKSTFSIHDLRVNIHEVEENLNLIKGKINFTRWSTQANDPISIPSRFNRLELNHPWNLYIRDTLLEYRHHSKTTIAHEVESLFVKISGSLGSLLTWEEIESTDNSEFDFYKKALELCYYIRNGNNKEEITLDWKLPDSHRIWEKWSFDLCCSGVLRESHLDGTKSNRYLVRKFNQLEFEPMSLDVFDGILETPEGEKVIFEAKDYDFGLPNWKDNLVGQVSTGVSQLIRYCNVSGIERGIILFPTRSSGAKTLDTISEEVKQVSKQTDETKVSLRVFAINIDIILFTDSLGERLRALTEIELHLT